jgi:hypothetical protein
MFKDQSIIKLEDTTMEMVMKMSEGNPGAVTVIAQILKTGGLIDPDDAFGGLGTILHMDTWGIRGPKIWMLYKDVCGQDLVKTIGMTRAVQLGFIPGEVLETAINSYGRGVDVEDCLTKVRKQLPRFGQPMEPAPAAV